LTTRNIRNNEKKKAWRIDTLIILGYCCDWEARLFSANDFRKSYVRRYERIRKE